MCYIVDGFVDIDIAIPDFQVEAAFRISTNPSLILNRCPLSAKIGQGYQVSGFTFLTFWKV